MAPDTLRHPDREPAHPGAVLRDQVLPALKMSVDEAARHLRMTPPTLSRVLAGDMGVTPEIALRFGKFCGNGPGLWLRMQEAHDLWHAERRLRQEIAAIPTVRDAA